MSSHPFPHAITISQFSSQEFDGSQQSRPDSPPPPPSPPNTNYAMETQTQLQESLAPPPSSPYSRQKQEAQRNATPRTQLRSQPESHHHLLSPSIPSAFQTEHRQTSNETHAPELNYNTITSSTQYTVSNPFPDFATCLFPFLVPGLPTLHSSSPYTSTSTSASFSTPSSSSFGPHSYSDSDLETGIEDDTIDELSWDAQHAQELAVQRAQHMCAWFTGVMLAILGVVGIVRWVVYG
ncbi:hypothetical protein EAE96_002309 [Botrytis aclada]|nr:hypothetical protein EAE96_002309 [Botrytis aclada]